MPTGVYERSKESRLQTSLFRKGKTYEELYGEKQALKLKQKCSERASGKNNPMFGMDRRGLKPKHRPKHTEETKRKMRLSHINRIIKINGYIYPNHNPASIVIIEEYGKQNGYNFQHAENGGEFHIKELGYWVDGYDKDKNVVIEYYEKLHNRTKEQDKLRKQEIIKYLNCTFIEVWYDDIIITQDV